MAKKLMPITDKENIQILKLRQGVSEVESLRRISSTETVESASLNFLRKADYVPLSQISVSNGDLKTSTRVERDVIFMRVKRGDIEIGDSVPVTVAVINSGIDLNHPNLSDKI